ncbi:Eukaryotic translation initiation factor 4G [Phytophthora citrophthora]|uniref:Eukaryotic translation initiation factor 4G n=1 Tax=Phytophthora citrophthora TaxID=4793 RepID=A0AAD9GHC0_9STRA|nr:Eukaryotic translation initiation factor 4G [Phytophthora citrophthora]
MDGRRRGGGRSGSLGRGGRGTYRRVQAPTTEDSGPDTHRLVQIMDGGDDGAPPAPFQSSLRSSLKDSMRQESKKKVNPDRKSPNNKDLQVQTKTQRQVISLSSPSPQKGAGQTKKFVSSLTQSMRDEDRGSRQDRGGKGGKGPKGSSLRRSSSRDPPRRSNSRDPPRRSNSREPVRRSNSRESRQWSGEGQGYRSGNRSVSRTRLQRKNSTDSVSSQRSDRSDRSYRSERYSEEYRSSLNDGPAPVRRLSSGSSLLTKSSQDVRVQKKRPVSGTIGRSIGRPAQDTSSRRSSLDGGASSLRRVNSSSPVGSSGDRLSSQDAHFTGALNSQRPTSGASGLRNNAPGGDSIAPKVEKSTVAQEKEDTPAKDPAPAAIDEAERKRRSDTLQKRMEARKLERGSSLAQMMKAPVSRKNSADDEAHNSPFGSRKELENGKAPAASNAEKEARTREYYAKLDKENAEREAAARATPFKSSLASAVEPGPTKMQPSLSASIDAIPPRTLRASIAASMEAKPVRTLKSSLAASLTSSRQAVSRTKKLQYSLAELRRIMEFALPRPTDLPNMKIVEVTQIRDPISVTKRSGRLGAGYGIGRSIGGSIRRDDRSGGRGARSQGGLRDGRRDRPGRGGRGGGRGGRGGGGGRGYGRPPAPPLYDGPIEPLVVTENRWKPAKEKDVSSLEKTLNHVKSLLNKLTREKFAKLTNELCSVDIDSFVLLSSIVSIIMDKALEEPNFADVYADLCKEFHARTAKKTWNFLSVLSDEKGSFYWTAIDKTTFTSFVGPFENPHSCLEDAGAPESAAILTCDNESIASVNFRRQGDYLMAVGEKETGAFFYSKRKISDIGGDEPFGGPFESAEAARHAATTQVTFTRLLVNRCQGEFEKTNKHVGQLEEKKEEQEIDPRRREIFAMRAKAKMLGNIRFIGELYKVDLIKQSGVQGCIFYLLGLELIPGDEGQEVQAQAARFPDEQDLEALCKMLATAGKKFDQPKTKTIMKIIILRMVELSDDTRLPSRARFLVKDVLETRDHMWEPRRKEMQQKTLEEVRREAQKLQQQGKNAQHDDVQRRRHKTRISSAQLAKQSSNLIVAKKEEPDEPEHDDLSPAQVSTRIKSIIQEYISILDLDEATTCVQELPMDPYHVEFAEQTINTALEGKTSEREHAVELLVGLYERGVLDANSIQAALVNVMEFLEDMKIDLPLIHQYSALIFGRLVAAGCFGFSWIISEALAHCVECKLTSLVFPEILSVLELESDARTVIRMLTDEEVTAESVLPSALRNEADVEAYLRENGIEGFFGEEEDELDEEVAGKMRSTLEEYLTVKDFDEVVLCMQELDVPERWRHFVHIMFAFGLEEKQSIRKDVAGLLLQLFTSEKITSEDIEAAVEIILVDYDDLRVDIPQLAVNLSELWTPLFTRDALTVQWLSEACSHLVESGRAADVLDALLSSIKAQNDEEVLKTWWNKQNDSNATWTLFSPAGADGNPKDERLIKWKTMLQS